MRVFRIILIFWLVSLGSAMEVSVLRDGIDVFSDIQITREDFVIVGNADAETYYKSYFGLFNIGLTGYGKTMLIEAAKEKYGDKNVDDVIGIKADKFYNSFLSPIYYQERIRYHATAIKYKETVVHKSEILDDHQKIPESKFKKYPVKVIYILGDPSGDKTYKEKTRFLGEINYSQDLADNSNQGYGNVYLPYKKKQVEPGESKKFTFKVIQAAGAIFDYHFDRDMEYIGPVNVNGSMKSGAALGIGFEYMFMKNDDWNTDISLGYNMINRSLYSLTLSGYPVTNNNNEINSHMAMISVYFKGRYFFAKPQSSATAYYLGLKLVHTDIPAAVKMPDESYIKNGSAHGTETETGYSLGVIVNDEWDIEYNSELATGRLRLADVSDGINHQDVTGGKYSILNNYISVGYRF